MNERGRMAAARASPTTVRSGFILASALVTLDGTATTIALPAIGRELSASVAAMQWIVNASLLALAAMLLPAGSLADRFGRTRMVRLGLAVFGAASCACALSPSSATLIAAKFAQGAGGAILLPAALAALRDAEHEAAERTRLFGVWAAWTGAASAAGPILAGALVDVASWRAVFVPSIVVALLASAFLPPGRKTRLENGGARQPALVPVTATAALMTLLGAVAYLLIEGPRAGLTNSRLGLPVVFALASGSALAMDPRRHRLFPRELLAARNCLPANAITFALYFGLFGLSFLAVLYVQQVLEASASWAAVVLLPVSTMLLLAERFGTLATRVGTRPLIAAGTGVASAGLAWIAVSPHPVPFWSHLVVGTALFGLGLSASVSTLTHAAVAAVPAARAGAASGLNHAIVRVAGLVSVALLGSVAAASASDAITAEGFRWAILICMCIVAGGGAAGTALLRDEAPGGIAAGDPNHVDAAREVATEL